MEREETFGERVRRLRNEKQWTLRQLAQKLDIKFPYLSQLEAGLATPSEDLIKRVAAVFDEDEEELLFLGRNIQGVLDEIRKKFPHKAPKYMRKILREEK